MKFEPEDRFADVKELKRRLNSLKKGENARTSVNAKINSVRYVNRYKRIVVTVDGNMGFACELAYVAATS